MVTTMVNICDDDYYLVMKVILVKEVMSCDVSPVAMFFATFPNVLFASKDMLKLIQFWCHISWLSNTTMRLGMISCNCGSFCKTAKLSEGT